MAACARNVLRATLWPFCRFVVVTHDRAAAPAGRRAPKIAVAPVQLLRHSAISPPLGATRNDRVVPVIVVQRRDMAGSDGVAGTVRIVAQNQILSQLVKPI